MRSISTEVSFTSRPVQPMVVRGRRHLEIALPHRVKAAEIVEIGEKHLGLDHVIERGAGRRESSFQILEDVGGLQLDIRAVIGKVLRACAPAPALRP